MRLKKTAILISAFLIILATASVAMASSSYTRTNPSWNYTIIHSVEVKNPTNKAITDIKVEVPLAANKSTTWQDFVAEELYPKPSNITTNADGIRIATYYIDSLAAGSTKVLKQSFGIINYPITFNIDSSCCDNTPTANVSAKYLQSETGINISDSAIVNYAKSVVNGSTNDYVIAKRLFSDINLYMTYDDSANIVHSASQAVRSGVGNCIDYTYLYVACLRSLGIPARWNSGYSYSIDNNSSYPYLLDSGLLNGNLLRHTWVEFYLDDIGWVVADPTFTYTVNVNGTAEKMVDWSRFANIDEANRLLWVSEGAEAVDDVKYTYVGSKPTVTFNSNIKLSMDISPYKDLAGHWAKDSVTYLANQVPAIVVGISANYYGVNESITRAQLITIVNRALKNSSTELHTIANISDKFTDIPDNYWAKSEIEQALSWGYVGGYSDNTFKPNAKVSRAELAAILARVAKLPYDNYNEVFTDLNQVGYKWCKNSVMQLYNAGLVSGITATKFAPQNYLTRGEAAVFIERWMTSQYYGN